MASPAPLHPAAATPHSAKSLAFPPAKIIADAQAFFNEGCGVCRGEIRLHILDSVSDAKEDCLTAVFRLFPNPWRCKESPLALFPSPSFS
jgi:hypothetical protein